MNIDFIKIKAIKKLTTSKHLITNTNDSILKEILSSIYNSFDFIKNKCTIHESCLWIESKANLLSNKGQVNSTTYYKKDILLVDLGADTYGHEFSYEHPCVVLQNEYKRVFVVPCTSQPARKNIHGKIYPEYLEGHVSDGFAKTTTILLKEAKFIDKTRVKSFLGKVSDPLYNQIYTKVFEFLFESKSYQIKRLIDINNKNTKEIEKITAEKEQLQDQLNTINKQYKELKCKYDNYILDSSRDAVNQ